MDIQKIKELGLSVADFTLIIKGLDSIPTANMGTDFMIDMMEGLITKDKDPAAADRIKGQRALEMAKKKQEMEIITEDIKILQGKLIALKRLLIEHNLLEQLR